MLTLVSLHVAAGLYHYFIRRDGVLQRMLPGA
jgi:cytochrome b561